MEHDYFLRLNRQTQNRFWVNNPTLEEAGKAIEAGAINCTTNPAFAAGVIRAEPAYAQGVLKEVLAIERDESRAADLIQQKMVQRIMDRFLPLYHANPAQGLVSLQGNPYLDEDEKHIIRECREHRRVGPNYLAKIPATRAGLKAMEELLGEGVPVISTECFSLAQAIASGELFEKVIRATGRRPLFFLTHITGIFDEYLAQTVKREKIAIAPHLLEQAGCIVARAQYRLVRERKYPVTLLGGGARHLRHFTELVGGPFHITINWSTAEEIFALNPPIEDRLNIPADPKVADELCEKIPDFRKAYREDGLAVEEFAPYGPVQHFRNKFLAGWDALTAAIRKNT